MTARTGIASPARPYGLPFQQNNPPGELRVFAPLRYPDRLLEHLAHAFAKAARGKTRPPGPITAFLDLNIARQYTHAVAAAWGLRVRTRWVNELLAGFLYMLALHRTNTELYLQARAWADLSGTPAPKRSSPGSLKRHPHRARAKG